MQTEQAALTIHAAPEREPMRPRRQRREGGKGLVLSRRLGESITIDGPATITLVRASDGRARLAIEAPEATTILRGELAAADEGEPNRAA